MDRWNNKEKQCSAESLSLEPEEATGYDIAQFFCSRKVRVVSRQVRCSFSFAEVASCWQLFIFAILETRKACSF